MNTPRLALLAGALLLHVSVMPPAAADVITFVDGRVIEGRVVMRSETKVRIEHRGVSMDFDASRIASIEESDPYSNTILKARSAFQNRRAVEGIDLVFQARREGAPTEELRKVIDEGSGGIAGSIRGARPSERPEIKRSLLALVAEDLLNDRSRFHLAQNLFELEDWDGTATTLASMDAELLRANPTWREWALGFMRLYVKRLLARGDFEQALGHVERMRLLSGGEASPQLPLAQLAAAASARERHDYKLAFQIIADELGEQVPEIARNRAWFTIEHLRQRVAVTGEYAEARRAIDPLRRLFPVEYSEARNEFIIAEARALIANDDPGMALRVLSTVPAEQRSTELEALHRRAFHESRLAELGETAALDLLQHARWCIENDLYEEAILLLNKTRNNPTLKAVSEELLTNAYRDFDTKLIEEAQEKYEIGDMGAVIALAQRVQQHPGRTSALGAEAARLEDLARKSMAREKELRPYQAEAFYQQAERAYFQQNHEEAFNLVNLVLRNYAETPAAARAAALLPDIVRQLEIAYLEGRNKFLPRLGADSAVTPEKIQQTDKLGEEVGSLLDALQTNPDGKPQS